MSNPFATGRRAAPNPGVGRRLASGPRGLALALLASGCFLFHAQTKIEQGQPVTTGVSEYDDFFRSVNELNQEASSGENDVADARAKLAHALALEDKADEGALVAAAGKRAKQLKEQGVLLHLELTPQAKLVVSRGKGAPDPDGDGVLRAVEECAKSSLAVIQRLGAVAEKAGDLEKKRGELLAQAAVAFKAETSGKRGDAEQELAASAAVLTRSSETGARNAGRASQQVVELARAVETGGLAAPVVVPEAAPKRGKRAWTSGSAGGATAPRKPPKSKGDDFDH